MIRTTRAKFALGNAAAIASVALLTDTASAAEFEFRCGSTLPLDHPSSVRLTQMWNAVRSESGGRINTKFFPDSQLGGESPMFAQVRAGALQFLLLSQSTLAAVIPSANICSVGFAFKDSLEALRAMDGPLGAYIRDEATSKGVHFLKTIWDSGMFQICSSTRAIRNPDDLKGFKIRVSESRIFVDLFRGLGSSPTPLGFSEIYTALQTKVVDGSSTPLVTIEAARFFEVTKFISLTNHAWSGLWVIANGDLWKSLPANLQEIIERNATKFGLAERRDAQIVNASLADKLARQGVAVNTVDQAPFRARLKPYFEFWANAFGATPWGMLETSLGRKLT